MKPFNKSNLFLFFLLPLFFCGCKKDWLDKKPDSTLLVPETLEELQALLDDAGTMNYQHPILGEIGSDNTFIINSRLLTSPGLLVSGYLWGEGNYGGTSSITSWDRPYAAIFAANKVIEIAEKIPGNTSNATLRNTVLGTAFFQRAYQYYNLAQIFTKPYIAQTAATELGLPLRTEANISEVVQRSSLSETYDLILTDLNRAKELLPSTAQYNYRPTLGAAHAMLARLYLTMANYDKAGVHADSSLQIKSTLLDYNTLSASAAVSTPAPNNNPEIIFYSRLISSSSLNQATVDVDSNLYSSYAANDLRRTIFYKSRESRIVWAGSYTGSATLHFGGLSVDEMYLIRSECAARKGDIANALKDLNTLMQKRWRSSVIYPVITATDANDALTKILSERRKEVPFRSLRWTDIRRLNASTGASITLSRFYNGNTYVLPPNSNKYAFPIPDNEILFSGITQNPR